MSTDLRDRLQSSLAGAYTLERELGGGGMSRVFVAEETALGRRVVVKVLPPELAAGLSADRFAREIRLAAGLQQANIVPVLSAGVSAGERGSDASPYYMMPFVEGRSLRERLAEAEGPLPVAEAVGILRDVARALDYAHAHGVVHRDIKPENVLLSGATAVVTDFGIAKALAASAAPAGPLAGGGTLTQAGFALGTPAYMAPEQATGDPGTDHRADLYALGVVAYELLAGAHPFAGRRSGSELIAAHVAEAPAPLAARRPDVPAPLAELVMRCLAKRPEERPAAARAVLAALDAIVTTPGGGVRAAPAPRRRLPARGLVAAGALAAALAGGAYALAGRSAASPDGAQGGAGAAAIRSLAVLPLENVGGDTAQEYFADGLTDELTTALGTLPGVRVASRSSAFTLKGRRGLDAREAGRRLGVGALVEGRVRRAGSRMRLSVQLTSAADGLALWSRSFEREVEDVLAVQSEIAAAVAEALRLELGEPGGTRPGAGARAVARRADPEAYDLYLRGRYFFNQGTRAGLERSLEYFQRSIARDSTLAPAHVAVSLTYFWLADAYLPPATVAPKAMDAVERAVVLDPRHAEAHGLLALLVASFEWDWERVRREAELALALSPSEAQAYQALYIYRGHHGDRAGAMAAVREWLRADPLAPITNHIATFCMLVLGEVDAAVAQARRAEEIAPGFVYLDTWTGHALLAAGRHAEALEHFRRAERTLGHPTPGLALAHARMGRRAEAAAVLRRLEALSARQHVVPEHVAHAYVAVGDHDAAFRWLERGVALLSSNTVWYGAYGPNPGFEPLRTDPRYRQIRRRLRLE